MGFKALALEARDVSALVSIERMLSTHLKVDIGSLGKEFLLNIVLGHRGRYVIFLRKKLFFLTHFLSCRNQNSTFTTTSWEGADPIGGMRLSINKQISALVDTAMARYPNAQHKRDALALAVKDFESFLCSIQLQMSSTRTHHMSSVTPIPPSASSFVSGSLNAVLEFSNSF
jgi:hypothetical protein